MEILKIYYQNPARWSRSFNVHHILHTFTWLRGKHSGKCCTISSILSCSRSQIVKNIANQRKNDAMVIILKSTRDYQYTSELQGICLQSLGRYIICNRHDYSTAKNSSILCKNVCISARWSTSLDAHHILHTGTWLRGEHSGKFCSISCNSVVHKLMKTSSISEDDANSTKLTITRNY